MIRQDSQGGHSFHEIPLVMFTGLAMFGCGMAAAYLPAWIVGWRPFIPTPGYASAAGAVMGVGLFFSLGHLGKPLRMLLTLRGVGRSPLSNEVLLAGVAFSAMAGTAFIPSQGSLLTGVWIVGVLASWATLIAIGRVYRLKGTVGWSGGAVFQPLLLGLAAGVMVLLLGVSSRAVAPPLGALQGELLALLILFLVLDTAAGFLRARRLTQGAGGFAPSHPTLFRRAQALLVSRFVLANVAPAILALSGQMVAALIVLVLGISADRISFYGLALRHSTESEIARVEEVWTAGRTRTNL
jgi:anaerobic dimethyl sulfoxide reductase subunit C (anchor subunit)